MKRVKALGLAFIAVFLYWTLIFPVQADQTVAGRYGSAASLVSGTTVITGGNTGEFLYNNAGVVAGTTTVTYSSGAFVVKTTGSGTPTIFRVPALTATGANNNVIGTGAGAALTSGTANTLIGTNAGAAVTTNADNVAIGNGALDAVDVAQTICIGTDACGGTAMGTGNLAIGYQAFDAANNAISTDNIAVGNGALGAVTSAATNIAIGRGAAAALTNGGTNVAIGLLAMDGPTGANQNVCIGQGNACGGPTVGDANTAVGYGALDATTSTAATNNVAVGLAALGSVTTGANNVGIGAAAGNSALTTGSSNTAIGVNTVLANASSQIALGAGATTTAANQMAVGGNATQITDVYWSEGVTNATPLAVTHNATGGSGTDIAGADFGIAGGKGTGAGTPGNLLFYTSTAAGSSSTLQTLSERMRIDGTGLVTLGVGGGTTLGGFGFNATQTVDTDMLYTGSVSNHWVMAEQADAGFDFAHAQATDPTLFIHSHNQNTTQWTSLKHDGTNGVISVGTGSLSIPNDLAISNSSSSVSTFTTGATNASANLRVRGDGGTFYVALQQNASATAGTHFGVTAAGLATLKTTGGTSSGLAIGTGTATPLILGTNDVENFRIASGGAITITSTFRSSATADIGWSVVAGADTACNTTCTNACVVGFDTGLGGADLVDCADATADRCLCAGAN